MTYYSRSNAENINPLSHKSTFSELKKVDPRTQQTFTQYISEDRPQNLSKYSDWSRVKVESINTINLSKHLRDTKQHYNDPQFPHNNSVLTRDNCEKHFKWQRIGRLVQKVVYSSKKSDGLAHDNIQLNRPALEKALLLLARAAPSAFSELTDKTINPEGLYEYKLFRGGFIQNVVVDDYVPVHDNMPIFVGPTDKNQVYPMLIEKAIAKVCGNYEDIPQKAEQILEMLFCGPVSTNSMADLRDKNTLGEKLQSSLQHRQLTVLISKKDHKIRNYGINDGQVYLVIKRHEIQWGGQQLKELQESRLSFLNQSQVFKPSSYYEFKSIKASRLMDSNVPKKLQKESSLNYSVSDIKNNQSVFNPDRKQTEPVYELISESKISAWNGRYSLNDQVWSKIDPQKKKYLYSQVNKNRSFLINEADISRLFEEVLIFEPNHSNNKDWIGQESHNGRPAFTRFTTTRNDHITLRVTASSSLSQTIVLVRQTAPKQYAFVASNFTPNSQSIEIQTSLFPGKYILATYHQWPLSRSGKYHAFVASRDHISLERYNLMDNEFLSKAIISLQESRQKTAKEQKEECTFRMELQRLGMAYMVLKPVNTKQKQFTLKIDQNRLQKEEWELHQPYKGLAQVTASEHLNKSQTILLLSKQRIDLNKKYYFPLSAFSIKK